MNFIQGKKVTLIFLSLQNCNIRLINGPGFTHLTRAEVGLLSLSCVAHRATPASAFLIPQWIYSGPINLVDLDLRKLSMAASERNNHAEKGNFRESSQ